MVQMLDEIIRVFIAHSGSIDLIGTIIQMLFSLKITLNFINYKGVFYIRMKLSDQKISSIHNIMVQM